MKKAIAMTASVAIVVSCVISGSVPAVAQTAGTGAAASVPALSPQLQAKIDAILAKLPDDWQARFDAKLAELGLDTEWTEIANSATGVSDEPCAPTEFSNYIGSLFVGANPAILRAVGMAGGFSVPFVDALLYATDATPQSFGPNGEYTGALTHEFRDLQNFWDIQSSDIQLVAMHGKEVFTDPARVARAIAFMYGISQTEALPIAQEIIGLIGQEPVLQGGAHPIFSLNAIAFTGKGSPDPVFAALPDRVIVGDGLLQAMAGIGLGDIGAKGILAHEFGHHVQYETGLLDTDLPELEAGRRAELMADAFSSYFLAHARGQAMNTKRLLDAEQSFFEVGDCMTEMPGHHGTPAQRMAAATWAADLANAARPQGAILPSKTFGEIFDAELPELVES